MMQNKTSRRRRLIGAGVAVTLAATACGSADGGFSSPGQASATHGNATQMTAYITTPCPTIESGDGLSVAVALVDELIRTEGVFSGAEPGSAAQFRSREVADDLRHRLETLLHRRCLRQ